MGLFIKVLFRNFYYPIIVFIARLFFKSITSNSLLIIKVDAIGDYILFRNFLKEIRESEKFKNYQITLLGNVAWKDLFETFDYLCVDRVIWMERKKLLNSPSYLFQILKKIRGGGFEIIFNPTYWRDYYVDSLVRVSNAPRKIGSEAFGPYYSKGQIAKANQVYSEIPSLTSSDFEFYKFRKSVEQLLNTTSITTNATFHFSNRDESSSSDPYFVIAPGANAEFRRWKPEFYASVANYVLKNTSWGCTIVGSAEDQLLAQKVILYILPEFKTRVSNLAGQVPLSALPSVLGKAEITFCNDTGTMHMAVASKCKVVCISNGNHYSRFVPYPKEMGVEAVFIFPPVFDNDNYSEEQKIKDTEQQSLYDINEIMPSIVENALMKTRWIE